MYVVKAKLLTYREEYGGYILYVFENQDQCTWNNKYVMTIRFPNWEAPTLKVGDIGFLSFKEVIAGETTWWDGQNKNFYNYDNIVFINFVHEKKDLTVKL